MTIPQRGCYYPILQMRSMLRKYRGIRLGLYNWFPPAMSGHDEESSRVEESWSRRSSLLCWEIDITQQSLSKHARHEAETRVMAGMGEFFA